MGLLFGGNCPGAIILGGIVQGQLFGGDNFPGKNCLGANCPEGNFPGGIDLFPFFSRLSDKILPFFCNVNST